MTMSGDTPNAEGRVARRQRVLKQGKILLPNNLSVIDCIIRDVSATGAKLLCGDPTAVPNEFRLVVLADGTMRDVKVAWRRPDQVGVHFTSEQRQAPPRKW
jgi:hypothetical protein